MAVAGGPELQSLAAAYEPDQHGSYLRHLEAAVTNPKNLNIAVTGRYGTGKSSVLDEFVRRHKKSTLRVTISTLGLESADVTVTNRIQKELVKQLLYRASPRQLRHSRFNRIVPLSIKRAALESLVAVIVLTLLAALLGLTPTIAGTGANHPWAVRVGSWAAFAALAVTVLTVLRLVLYDRFMISDVSAGGAAIKLGQRTATYFDEYLDEIVYFFDEVAPDIVIFEDLDRFDDPHIFEALRELNTLLNSTAKRRVKGEPLRFIFAIKDSLFERLGTDTVAMLGDAAAAETVRANRTKFFDVVIPLVPFISHRNARELLVKSLNESGISGIDRHLVTLVSQHATDMRLLKNICNEYVVFAERLLGSERQAPGLTASNLFGLVVYKNFHLEDFEQISRRHSDLDQLYDSRRQLVRSAIEAREKRRRDLSDGRARSQSRAPVAQRLGKRLEVLGQVARVSSGHGHLPHLQYSVASERFGSSDAMTYGFWASVSHAGQVSILASSQPSGGGQVIVALDRGQLDSLFPESKDASRWDEVDSEEVRTSMASLDAEVAFLRGADFKDLASDGRFKIETEDGEESFADVIDATMDSELARELVKNGYLDRNFALYAAQFYGDFTGVDVATFIVQSVQTNTMDIDYTFSGSEAVANLLEEAPSDFTRTVCVFNIDVVDYLLASGDARARDVVDQLAGTVSEEAPRFLGAYFNSGKERARLSAELSSRPWLQVFQYLITEEDIPEELRAALVDSALLAAKKAAHYELSQDVRDFILANFQQMSAFTKAHSESVTSTIVAIIKKSGVILPALHGLHESMRRHVVREHLYLLTAPNLRAALGDDDDISLDRVCTDEDVYDFCRDKPSDYLSVVEQDARTPHAVLTPSTLASVLTDVSEQWDEAEIEQLLRQCAPESALPRLAEAPETCWPALAAAKLIRPTLANLEAYRRVIGSIDASLAELLIEAGHIDAGEEDEEAKADAAAALIAAAGTIGPARTRVDLASSLGLSRPLELPKVAPEPGELMGLLLNHGLVADTAATFQHFRSAGWSAFEPAISSSQQFEEFVTPDLIDGFVADLLGSAAVPERVRTTVTANLAQFLPTDDVPALQAAARFSIQRSRPLPLDQIRRIASATRSAKLVVPLLAMLPAPAPTDVVDVLSLLGEPYSYVSTGGKDRFDVPADDAHRAVLDLLRKAGMVSEFKKKRLQDVFGVRLTT